MSLRLEFSGVSSGLRMCTITSSLRTRVKGQQNFLLLHRHTLQILYPLLLFTAYNLPGLTSTSSMKGKIKGFHLLHLFLSSLQCKWSEITFAARGRYCILLFWLVSCQMNMLPASSTQPSRVESRWAKARSVTAPVKPLSSVRSVEPNRSTRTIFWLLVPRNR